MMCERRCVSYLCVCDTTVIINIPLSLGSDTNNILDKAAVNILLGFTKSNWQPAKFILPFGGINKDIVQNSELSDYGC